MRIKHRLGYNKSNLEITNALAKLGITFTDTKTEIVNTFDLYEDEDNYKKICKLYKKSFYISPGEGEYTKEEFEEAEWLSIRSTWRSDYPQPENNFEYEHITYDASDYCDKCKKGLIQKDKFKIKKQPNWGPRNFLMINWIHDELFVTDKVEKTLIDNGMKGMDFYEVLNKSGAVIDNTKQIYVKNYLMPGLIFDKSEEVKCPKCSFTVYMPKPGYIKYNREVFKDIGVDIVKSHEKFGVLTCINMIFVTKKFYDVVKNNKLDRGLSFEPLKLIDL